MRRPPTIYEIREKTKNTQPYFFDRSWMQVYGQRMSRFRVTRTETPDVYFVFCPGIDGHDTRKWFWKNYLYDTEADAIRAAAGGIEWII